MADGDDKFILLLDKLSEIGERTVRMETEQKNMKDDLEEVKRQDILQNQLLDEHIRGVELAHSRLDNEIKVRESIQLAQTEIKGRVESLEVTPKFFKSIYSILMYAGGIIGIVYEAGRILHKW
jgi:hypothetical protein